MAKNSFLDTTGKYVNYDKEEDGTVRIACSSCGEIQEVKDKQAAAAEANPTTFNCISCWRKGKDQDRQEVQLSTQDRIAWNSALNNAVASCGTIENFNDLWKKTIRERQDYFYKLLTERK